MCISRGKHCLAASSWMVLNGSPMISIQLTSKPMYKYTSLDPDGGGWLAEGSLLEACMAVQSSVSGEACADTVRAQCVSTTCTLLMHCV